MLVMPPILLAPLQGVNSQCVRRTRLIYMRTAAGRVNPGIPAMPQIAADIRVERVHEDLIRFHYVTRPLCSLECRAVDQKGGPS